MKLPDGRPLDVAAANAGFGGWWHTDDTIVFATGRAAGLMRVNASGGDASPIRVSGIAPSMLRYPQMLPDGRTIVATEWRLSVRHSQVVTIDVATGTARVVAPGVFGRWVRTGHFLFLRSGSLMAMPLGGTPRVVVPDVMTGISGAGQFTVASNGTLLYVPEAPTRRHRTVAQVDIGGGRLRPLPFEPRAFQNIGISPDGRRIATTIYEDGASDIWIGDIARGTLSKIPGSDSSVDPIWSSDGASVLFATTRGGELHLEQARADAATPPAVRLFDAAVSPTAAAPDGALLVQGLHPQRHMDIRILEPDGRLTDWKATEENESRGRLSPDGRWVAYQSMKSGRWDVYVRPFRGAGDEQLVSRTGGYDASWGPGGRSICYLSGTSIMQASFDGATIGAPSVLLTDPDVVLLRSSGNTVLVLKRIAEHVPVTTLNLVVNWLDELRDRRD
jgi:Tol biopolymer transport system component